MTIAIEHYHELVDAQVTLRTVKAAYNAIEKGRDSLILEALLTEEKEKNNA